MSIRALTRTPSPSSNPFGQGNPLRDVWRNEIYKKLFDPVECVRLSFVCLQFYIDLKSVNSQLMCAFVIQCNKCGNLDITRHSCIDPTNCKKDHPLKLHYMLFDKYDICHYMIEHRNVTKISYPSLYNESHKFAFTVKECVPSDFSQQSKYYNDDHVLDANMFLIRYKGDHSRVVCIKQLNNNNDEAPYLLSKGVLQVESSCIWQVFFYWKSEDLSENDLNSKIRGRLVNPNPPIIQEMKLTGFIV